VPLPGIRAHLKRFLQRIAEDEAPTLARRDPARSQRSLLDVAQRCVAAGAKPPLSEHAQRCADRVRLRRAPSMSGVSADLAPSGRQTLETSADTNDLHDAACLFSSGTLCTPNS